MMSAIVSRSWGAGSGGASISPSIAMLSRLICICLRRVIHREAARSHITLSKGDVVPQLQPRQISTSSRQRVLMKVSLL
jgi:hypothetical protein